MTTVSTAGGCDGTAKSGAEIDRCGVCGGINSCVDCADVPFGGLTLDACGVCGGSTPVATCTGCDGVVYLVPATPLQNDLCGVCGGNGNDLGCDGQCNSAKALDECGTCGGDGTQCAFEPKFTIVLSRASSLLAARTTVLCFCVAVLSTLCVYVQ